MESAGPSADSGKVKSKHVMVAVTCLVVLIVLVGGLLGAAYVFKAAANDIVKVGNVNTRQSVCFCTSIARRNEARM